MSYFTSTYDYLIFLGIFSIIALFFSVFFIRIYNKSVFLQEKSSFLEIVLGITLFFIGLVFVIGLILTQRLEETATKKLHNEAQLTSSIIKTAVDGELSKIDAATRSLQGAPWIREYLQNRSPGTLARANECIDRYCNAFKASVVYIMDTNGITIASSNRNRAESFVGQNYSFRPYYTKAIKGESSNYFATGISSHKPGYFSSASVIDSSGKICGIIVIKDDLSYVDSIISSIPLAFLSNSDNIIFLTSIDSFVHRPFFPIPDSIQKQLDPRQFNKLSFRPIFKTIRDDNEYQFKGRSYFFSKTQIQTTSGWFITLLYSKDPVFKFRLLGFTLTITLILCILVTISLIALHRVKLWVDSIFLSEKLFQSIFENAPEAIFICDPGSGKIISGNSIANKLLDLKKCNDMVIINLFEPNDTLQTTVSLPLTPESFQGLFKIKSDTRYEYFSVSSAYIHLEGKYHLLAFLRDITNIIETQNALEKSEQKYRELTEFLPEGIFETDEKGVFTYTNKCGLRMFGYEPEDIEKKLTILDVIAPEEHTHARERLKNLFDNKQPIKHEYIGLHKDGKRFPILVHSIPTNTEESIILRGIVIDLTERKKIEQELQKTDKLEALGILAGGIAHDFNNILTGIKAGISLIKTQQDNLSDFKETINDIEFAITRGKDLTGQLLTYSKGGAPVKAATSLVNLVKTTASFTTTGTNIRCNFSIENNLHSADIDATQISQVIQNLLLNARDSMPSGGIIEITLRNFPESNLKYSNIEQGKYVELIISDSGSGIPPEIQHRIYDPFFTTKKKGNGLGLATTHSIIKKHNGHIFFESTTNKGTTFHILLPASDAEITVDKQIDEISHHGHGTILLMDDEEIIRNVTKKLLNHLGYKVTTAVNGEETLQLYEDGIRKNERYDLVILDLTIAGGMGGKETIKKLLEIDPMIKALVSSGYSNDPIMSQYAKYGFIGIVSKPYDIHELNRTIEKVIKRTG